MNQQRSAPVNPHVVRSLDMLTHLLYLRSWAPGSSFVSEGLTLVSSTASRHGAQLYVIYRGGREVERITVSRMQDPRQLTRRLRLLAEHPPLHPDPGAALPHPGMPHVAASSLSRLSAPWPSTPHQHLRGRRCA